MKTLQSKNGLLLPLPLSPSSPKQNKYTKKDGGLSGKWKQLESNVLEILQILAYDLNT